MTVVKLSPADLKGFAHAAQEDPAMAKLYSLIVDEASRRGGLSLQAYKLHQGQLFGEPVMMTLDEVANRLNLPLSTITEAIRVVYEPAAKRWKITEEFRKSPYARLRSQK